MLAGDSFTPMDCVLFKIHRLQRLMLVLLILHYLVELSFHVSRLLHYHQKKEIASSGFVCIPPTASSDTMCLFHQVYLLVCALCCMQTRSCCIVSDNAAIWTKEIRR